MRVSSTTERQKTDLQHDALIAAGVDERHLYTDHASGAKEDRPGLDAALEFLKPGDVFIVWKLDRLGRSLSHLIAILDQLRKKKIAFRSLTEGMDTTTAAGEMLYNIFGSFAQFERALAKERIRAGLDAAKERGRIGGRPRAISDEKLRAIVEALESGRSKAEVCRLFDVKRSTLIDALARIT